MQASAIEENRGNLVVEQDLERTHPTRLTWAMGPKCMQIMWTTEHDLSQVQYDESSYLSETIFSHPSYGWCHTTILYRPYIWSPFNFVYIKLILPQQRQMPFINIVSDHDLICDAKYVFQICQISYSLEGR
jgi:hypothetical protein